MSSAYILFAGDIMAKEVVRRDGDVLHVAFGRGQKPYSVLNDIPVPAAQERPVEDFEFDEDEGPEPVSGALEPFEPPY